MPVVRIENSNGELMKEISVDANRVLLSQIEAAGIEIPNACRTGSCASCMCHIVQWSQHIEKSLRWEPWFPLDENELMTCISGVRETDETIILRTMY
jgi:ferredoxin